MERYWAEITVETVPVLAEMAGEILLETGCGGLVCHEPPPGRNLPAGRSCRVTGYLPVRDGLDDELAKIKSRLAALDRYFPPGEKEARPRSRVFLRRVREENWAETWKEYFRPQVIGRLVIIPTWEKIKPAPGQVVVEIDPGMAFGTGTHPSTRLSLLLLQEVIRGGETVYDIGAGTGILALAAAGLGAARVAAVDIDPAAVQTARENVRHNKMEGRVEVSEDDLGKNLGQGADLVVVNIVAGIIVSLIPRLPFLLNPGGRLIASGLVDAQAGGVRKALMRTGFRYQKELREDGWVACLAGMGDA